MEGDIAASSILVKLKLLHGVASCKGLPRCLWITKYVSLKDNDGVPLKDNDGEFVAIGICHNVSPDLVVGSVGLLGPNKVDV
jgi:hypothetical protein